MFSRALLQNISSEWVELEHYFIFSGPLLYKVHHYYIVQTLVVGPLAQENVKFGIRGSDYP